MTYEEWMAAKGAPIRGALSQVASALDPLLQRGDWAGAWKAAQSAVPVTWGDRQLDVTGLSALLRPGLPSSGLAQREWTPDDIRAYWQAAKPLYDQIRAGDPGTLATDHAVYVGNGYDPKRATWVDPAEFDQMMEWNIANGGAPDLSYLVTVPRDKPTAVEKYLPAAIDMIGNAATGGTWSVLRSGMDAGTGQGDLGEFAKSVVGAYVLPDLMGRTGVTDAINSATAPLGQTAGTIASGAAQGALSNAVLERNALEGALTGGLGAAWDGTAVGDTVKDTVNSALGDRLGDIVNTTLYNTVAGALPGGMTATQGFASGLASGAAGALLAPSPAASGGAATAEEDPALATSVERIERTPPTVAGWNSGDSQPMSFSTALLGASNLPGVTVTGTRLPTYNPATSPFQQTVTRPPPSPVPPIPTLPGQPGAQAPSTAGEPTVEEVEVIARREGLDPSVVRALLSLGLIGGGVALGGALGGGGAAAGGAATGGGASTPGITPGGAAGAGGAIGTALDWVDRLSPVANLAGQIAALIGNRNVAGDNTQYGRAQLDALLRAQAGQLSFADRAMGLADQQLAREQSAYDYTVGQNAQDRALAADQRTYERGITADNAAQAEREYQDQLGRRGTLDAAGLAERNRQLGAIATNDQRLVDERGAITGRVNTLADRLSTTYDRMGELRPVDYLGRADLDRITADRTGAYMADVDRAAQLMASQNEAGLMRGGIDRTDPSDTRSRIAGRIGTDFNLARTRAADDAMRYFSGVNQNLSLVDTSQLARRRQTLDEVGTAFGSPIDALARAPSAVNSAAAGPIGIGLSGAAPTRTATQPARADGITNWRPPTVGTNAGSLYGAGATALSNAGTQAANSMGTFFTNASNAGQQAGGVWRDIIKDLPNLRNLFRDQP